MGKIGINILFFLFVSTLAGAQTDSPTARLLARWAQDGIVPITSPSPDGTQNLAVLAYGNYFPVQIKAKAGVPSVLRIYTNRTFDCSRALVLPQYRIRKNLPATGVVEIPLPPGKKGEFLFGTCTMNMYSFQIRFE